MANKNLFFIIALLVATISCSDKGTELNSNGLKMIIDGKGFVTSFTDKATGKEYMPAGQVAPLLSIRCAGELETPSQLEKDGSTVILRYKKNNIEARVDVSENAGYLSFELKDIFSPKKVELVIWGPFPSTIGETIGECVGVVSNNEFALGIQALNVKTLGGYPTSEDDVEPAFDIFATDNLADISADWKKKKHFRGQTAKAEGFGSVLQAYCRNRGKERVIKNWRHDYYVAPAYGDGGVIGSKIALFGCPAADALKTIGEIEIAEGLPHPTINGEWAKTSNESTASYLIIGFGEQNLDKAIALTHKAGLKYLYQGGPFETWGNFALNKELFPDNWESMKNCADRANEQGIKLGLHTLSNFITTNDAYVTPVPDKRLAKVGEGTLPDDIDIDSEEIPIESPKFFNQMKNNSLHSVVVGDEIIRYRAVSVSAPWKLTGCTRGAFGTKASAHKKGETIGKLMDHGYKVFLSDAGLSEEIAQNIARLFNQTGLMQISFDGLEGTWSTGMGQYARSLFIKTWFDNLKPELQGKIINDASNPGHFNWHINTRYNWGEPWYAGFRESQTSYRLMNQDFFQRNLLPAMLGWFSMTPQTSIEDAEWLLARAAGFDAGFAFNVNFDVVGQNGQSDTIFSSIKNWETARMCGAFSQEQKTEMQDINTEYHLEPFADGEWELSPYHIERYEHKQKVRQPGEPLSSTFEFANPYGEQPMMFILNLLPGENSSGSSAKNITIEINNCDKIEIPVKMLPYQSLKLGQDGKIRLFDKNWKLLQTVDMKNKIPTFANGENSIVFDAGFSKGGKSFFKIEVKTIGEAETIKKQS